MRKAEVMAERTQTLAEMGGLSAGIRKRKGRVKNDIIRAFKKINK